MTPDRDPRGLARALVVATLVATATSARADEWTVAKPKSAGKGPAVTLKRTLDDAARLPVAQFRTRQEIARKDEKREILVDFEATLSPADADEKGRHQVRVAVAPSKVSVDGDDSAPKLREAGIAISVLSPVDAKGFVASGTTTGAEGLGTLGPFLRTSASWALPYLPEKPVRVGDAWDLPIPYFLWSVNQPGDAPAEGFVTQVLTALEDRDGVRCAKVKTVFSLRRPQPPGMTPEAVGIGEGAALSRFRGEGTSWIDLDGCLREEVLDVKMRIENTTTKAWMQWTLHREGKARPRGAAAPAPPPNEWQKHLGKLDFVVGFAAGMERAWAEGRPAMLFFTSRKDKWCPLFAARTWKDPEVLEKVKAYLPVLVDAEAEPALREKYTVLLLPAVVWVDSEGDQIFAAVGDIPLDLFRTLAEGARDRAPEVKPSESYVAVTKAAEAMRAAVRSGDARGALRAVRQIQEVGRPPALVAEAKEVEERIGAQATEALGKAKELVAAGKKAEAKDALGKIRETYGDHPVGREAWTLLRELQAKDK
jgi:hypothetical protein